MKCAILSVGTELLMGQVTDTNSVFLSYELNLLGIDVLYHYTVGDNDARLSEVLELAFTDCDLVITTGGLGPTEDDMTKETVARFMGDRLVLHEPTAEALHSIENNEHRKFTENTFRQAMMPSRAEVFDTDKGTAPGFALKDLSGEKIIISLPGPPEEMTRMYERRVKPYLKALQTHVIYYKVLRIFGLGEPKIETELLDLIDAQTDPTIATYAKPAECTVRIASKRPTLEEAKKAVDEVSAEVRKRIGEYIFSDDDEPLETVVGRKLIERNISISSAESCTGGKFADRLTSVPGISQVFERGIVTYTPRAKMEELGVHEETIEKYTVVSPEVCAEMAEGLAEKTGSDICLSVTGAAGPSRGDDGKPVGLIYIGARWRGSTYVRMIETHRKDREWNRNYAVISMLDLANLLLDGRDPKAYIDKTTPMW